MYRKLLLQYCSNYAAEGTPVASVDMWLDCDVGKESTLGIVVTRNQQEPIWELRDSTGGLIERVNVGDP